MKKKNSLILYYDYYQQLKHLSHKEKGILLDSLFEYEINGTLPEVDRIVQSAFNFIKLHLDKNKEAYEAKCLKNKENIEKRWVTNVNERIRTYTKHTDKDKDKDKDKDINSIREIYSYYQEKINKNSVLTEKAKNKIRNRLSEFGADTLKEAIECFSCDAWRMEYNSNKGLSWFFHSEDNIAKFLELKKEDQRVKAISLEA